MENRDFVWIESKSMFDLLFPHLSEEYEEGESATMEVPGEPERKFTNEQKEIINNLKLRAEYVEFEEV